MTTKSVKRTADLASQFCKFQSPASRAHRLITAGFPALKCWAIFKRPRRGLNQANSFLLSETIRSSTLRHVSEPKIDRLSHANPETNHRAKQLDRF